MPLIFVLINEFVMGMLGGAGAKEELYDLKAALHTDINLLFMLLKAEMIKARDGKYPEEVPNRYIYHQGWHYQKNDRVGEEVYLE